jgi:hypothetical protein
MKKRKDKINKLYAQQQKLGIKKYQASENKTVVVMPSPQVKKDLTDYAYGKDIDERVVKMAMQMAEKLAVSMLLKALQAKLRLNYPNNKPSSERLYKRVQLTSSAKRKMSSHLMVQI